MSEELIVLVPLYLRHKHVGRLLTSFAGSGAPGKVVFVVTESDTQVLVAVEASGADYILTQKVSWPHKINAAYLALREEANWFLFAADDIDFHPGWWEATQPLRDQPKIMVIGTNDLGNPRVMAGDHATHALVGSTYMGTIDDPEAIVHTGYRHWCVDDEFVWTAKLRGAWSPCLGSIVEHLHPYWSASSGKKKGAWDATYAQGESGSVADMNLWKKRARLLGLQVG